MKIINLIKQTLAVYEMNIHKYLGQFRYNPIGGERVTWVAYSFIPLMTSVYDRL